MQIDCQSMFDYSMIVIDRFGEFSEKKIRNSEEKNSLTICRY